jgi:RND family efflux transporter MFP subunit
MLMGSRPRPEIVPKKALATLVEVMNARPERQQIKVQALGTVIPAERLDLTTEVGGRIVELNPQLVPGGIIRKGDVIARIDDRDYKTALKQCGALVEDVRFNLKVEEGNQVVAKREWQMFDHNDASDANSSLALREPHLARLKASLESAEGALAQAKLNVERTVITAPFNCLVLEEYLETGQVVNQQTRLATLVGTDSFWVQVNVPVGHLSHICLPDVRGKNGAKAKIISQTGTDKPVERSGQIVRLLGDVEIAGKMARLLIEVEDPLELLTEERNRELPLLVNAFVKVEIEGYEMENVLVLPRTAIHEGNRVWLLNDNNQLEIREVRIAWSREEDVLIGEGIAAGERIITSRIAAPVPGMSLRTKQAKVGE